jgi:5,10-methylene-tetrahydrofolate dehydrogenase/methenyl tetrahydrofolate cyclohydrolase
MWGLTRSAHCKLSCFQLQEIDVLNQDPNVHGVIVQLPLPPHLREDVVCNGVASSKDVDGFSASNLGRLVQGGVGDRGVFVPCTALAVVTMLKVNISINKIRVPSK